MSIMVYRYLQTNCPSFYIQVKLPTRRTSSSSMTWSCLSVQRLKPLARKFMEQKELISVIWQRNKWPNMNSQALETCQVSHSIHSALSACLFCDVRITCCIEAHAFSCCLHTSLLVCIAKTQYSFSCDPKAKGVPTGFRILVREIRSCVGAGFLYPICKFRVMFSTFCIILYFISREKVPLTLSFHLIFRW